ncbi:MAG: hypothetical protein NZO58_11470, partial [Gemmataceae bacterium]|nr:hypothetical protein [Gemmataceae bacterium]
RPSEQPSELERAVEPLAATPSGVGLTEPPWLERLHTELARIRQTEDPLVSLAEARLQVPRCDVSFAELVGEFDGWEHSTDD